MKKILVFILISCFIISGFTSNTKALKNNYYSTNNKSVQLSKKISNLDNDRHNFAYWNKYNHYSDKLILSRNEIERKNKYNISHSKYLNKLEDMSGEYGFISRRVVLKSIPENKKNPDTFDDYSAQTGLFPWDRVVIKKYTSDKKWAFIYSVDYSGWIPTNSIMKVSRGRFLKNKDKKFVTYINRQYKSKDGYMIDMGTYLPLREIGDNYYVVDIPITGNEYRVRSIKLSNNEAVEGYLPFTQKNIIKQALKFQGERYGWGHSNSSRDCSGFVRDVYRSFGIVMSRDTSKQSIDIIGKKINFKGTKIQIEKEKLLRKQLPGDTFYMPGHVFIYLGVDQNNRPNIVHQYGYLYSKGVKIRRFRNEITDANAYSTRKHSFLYYVNTGVSFIRGL